MEKCSWVSAKACFTLPSSATVSPSAKHMAELVRSAPAAKPTPVPTGPASVRP